MRPAGCDGGNRRGSRRARSRVSSRTEGSATSTFVIVHGAWGSPIEMKPVVRPLESAGHDVVVADLPCADPDATLGQYAAVVRGLLPHDRSDVVLVGHSFGGFTVSTVAAENPGMPAVYVAAFVPRAGASAIDIFLGDDPFADRDEAAGIAAFGGLIDSAGPGLCRLDIDRLVKPLAPSEQAAARSNLAQTQRPQGISALREKWRGALPTANRLTYVVTTGDELVPPGAQRAMAATVDAEVVEIETGHTAFRENPLRLAELLDAASR